MGGGEVMLPDPLLKVYFGPNWKELEGWRITVMILPARSVMQMRGPDEGRLVLCGLMISLKTRWPFRCMSPQGRRDGSKDREWRSPLSIFVRSDAGEIATRLAAGAVPRPVAYS